ncbi:hypothetical protein BCR33DRAFT_579055 [Rhizoclosmatium globosum]|uniref:Uncharacterized protein n=1 Tax=Rhizoclosmatium globosum TaxID=329046 RepID=A0A1Y2B5A2_9FUNG|nr:hypothetical protein BCR33DRAFT_579055 [Rhizoclosmatium globosum]|eukprot:ORY29275.1 hypothetical protein BCR33DRAFT_579055 [Rhizoclosmatium globosum]
MIMIVSFRLHFFSLTASKSSALSPKKKRTEIDVVLNGVESKEGLEFGVPVLKDDAFGVDEKGALDPNDANVGFDAFAVNEEAANLVDDPVGVDFANCDAQRKAERNDIDLVFWWIVFKYLVDHERELFHSIPTTVWPSCYGK